MNELERIRKEHEELKATMKGGGGQFGNEESRMKNLKRNNEQMMSTDSGGGDMWSDFTRILTEENKLF